jgi:AraC-like DNA-binding protein
MNDTHQLFLDPDLRLYNVAQVVKLSDRVVSQVIRHNAALNFADYINLKSINYAKEVLRTTARGEKNILEILYEAGFNSKSVFNTQFKKNTGLSPTLYRESVRDK